MTDVPVSQAARNAAAEYLPLADEECGECERGLMRCGEMDDHWLVQAFAKFEQSIRQQAERDALARMEPVGWRPIETAPKDGTIIDLWVRPYHGIAYRACDYWWLESAGVWRTHVRSRDIPTGYQVTHWRPVPTPPAGEA